MKKIQILALLFVAATLSVSAQKSAIDTSKSLVEWTGKKIGGSHTGEIKMKSGELELKDGELVSGKVVMDMNSITNTDLTDEGYNQKLVGHLKSDDFFGVEQYPTASFTLTKSSKFMDGKASVTGTLTIKGRTEAITFDVVKDRSKYSAKIDVDRSEFNVRYGSNSFFNSLGDKAIDDVFTLNITLAL